MKIKDELLHIANHIPGIHTAEYSADFEANFNNTIEPVNTIDFPYFQMQDLQTGSISRNPVNGLYRTTWNIGVFICVPTDFDSNTAENQDLIEDEVIPLVKRFINEVNLDGRFNPVENIALRVYHKKFDYMVTGVLALFSLTERVGEAIC